MAIVLGVDVGTSGTKAVAINEQGALLASALVEYPLLTPKPDWAEQDPAEWWKAFLTATKRLLRKDLVPIKDIVAVSNSSQWSGTVAVDTKGKHLMNAISWLDTRGAPYIKNKFKGLIKVSGYNIFAVLRWLRKTGGIPVLSGKDPIAHILYIKNEHPKVYKETHNFLEPTDFINLKLTGEFATSPITVWARFHPLTCS